MRTLLTVTVWVLVSFLWLRPAWGQHLEVLRVIDGDTIRLVETMQGDTLTVRLIGIDTPETYTTQKLYRDAKEMGMTPEQVQALGELATQEAKRLLEGKVIGLGLDPANSDSGHRGYYDRTLGYVWAYEKASCGQRCGVMLNRHMVEQGFAEAVTDWPFQFEREFVRLEAAAKQANVGPLWR